MLKPNLFDKYHCDELGIITNTKTGRIIMIGMDRNGYAIAHLFYNKKNKTVRVHLVMDLLYTIDRPAVIFGKSLFIYHKNGNKMDNSLTNLVWRYLE